jgi:hypothetical protein
MATEVQEMEDLGGICGALLVNIGTMRSQDKDSMLKAGELTFSILSTAFAPVLPRLLCQHKSKTRRL